jgi:Na+-transporting NADH:ubiquinone oxidoreductase subunit NqrF
VQVIKVSGLASGRSKEFSVTDAELEDVLLNWLRLKGITIASSCDGEGVCRKCDIQNGWLTCQMTVRMFLSKSPAGIVEVSYL